MGPWLAMGHDFSENSVLLLLMPLPLAITFAALASAGDFKVNSGNVNLGHTDTADIT